MVLGHHLIFFFFRAPYFYSFVLFSGGGGGERDVRDLFLFDTMRFVYILHIVYDTPYPANTRVHLITSNARVNYSTDISLVPPNTLSPTGPQLKKNPAIK